MATEPKSAQDILPSRYTESRTPQFVGGGIDTSTGNVTPISQNDNKRPTASASTSAFQAAQKLTPQASTTRLGGMSAEPAPAKSGSMASGLGGAAGGYLGSSIGSSLAAGATMGEALGAIPGQIAADSGSFLSGLTGSGTSAGSGTLAGSSMASTLGGGVGAGLGTFAVDLLSGKDFGTAALHGGISAAAFAIGNMILPGIGGFVGSFLAGLFF